MAQASVGENYSVPILGLALLTVVMETFLDEVYMPCQMKGL